MQVRCEILVVGAGVAGVPAALAAARAGADTVLVEKTGLVGGAGVAGLHRYICGLYTDAEGQPAGLLNAEHLQEGADILAAPLARGAPVRMGRVDVLPYDRSRFRADCERLLAARTGLRVLREAPVSAVTVEGRRICRVVAGPWHIETRVVIDCSGDGAVIRRRPDLHVVSPPGARQLAGYAVRVKGLRRADAMLAIAVSYVLRQGVEAGALPPIARFTAFTPEDAPDEGVCKFSLPASDETPAPGMPDGIRAALHYLSAHLEAFRDVVVVEETPGALPREGARLRGQYTLTADDVLGAAKFPDAVARNAWPVEWWDPVCGPTFRYLPTGAWHEVPARCLRAQAVDNLLCAGRCLSATPEALASVRVMGACLALGEAAGRLAAEHVRGKPEGSNGAAGVSRQRK